MPSIIQDLELVDVVLGDIVEFAQGKPVATTVGGYAATIQVLPNGPAAPYLTIGGGLFGILGAVLESYEAFASGQPIYLAVKENVTWYGVSLAKPVPTVVATPPPA